MVRVFCYILQHYSTLVMAAKDTAKNLAVYVIGKSGKCSVDYIGCGKSCLCRQYMYNEYAEESYSTLLQSEFDGCVINRQHVIYWGKKEEVYKEMAKGQCSFVAKVNFEVFEHTIIYQDGLNQPFHGSNNYENRVFSPLKSYLNKYSFKSRDDVLNPEDYDSKKFSYSHVVPVAYLYVIDVSQSCPVFEEQLQMMSKLVKDIHKKKQTCVVVATKFDTHCRTNLERLESLASKLKLTVIQCSAKYNTNINLAFKYLAAKALHLKKLSVNVLTHAEAAVQKRVENAIE